MGPIHILGLCPKRFGVLLSVLVRVYPRCFVSETHVECTFTSQQQRKRNRRRVLWNNIVCTQIVVARTWVQNIIRHDKTYDRHNDLRACARAVPVHGARRKIINFFKNIICTSITGSLNAVTIHANGTETANDNNNYYAQRRTNHLYLYNIIYVQTADAHERNSSCTVLLKLRKLQKKKYNKPIKISVCMTLVYTHCSGNITKNECV